MTDAHAAAFRAVLLRAPRPDELQPLRAAFPDPAAMSSHLRQAAEYRLVIAPLAGRVRALAEWWQRDDLLPEQLEWAVNRARSLAGSDEAVRRALAGGTVVRLLGLRPINLEVDVTNQCNLRCVMCLFSTPEYYRRPRSHLTVGRFAELAAEVFPVCHRVSLSYGTEPLLHPEIGRLMEIACSYGVPRTYMNTNGLLLTDRLIDTMIATGFGALCVSIDAATAATYHAIRRGGDWQRLTHNLGMLRDRRQRNGGPVPELQMAFVLRRDNVHELPAFVDLAADFGASGVNAMHMIPFAGLDNGAETAANAKAATNAALATAAERAAARGIRLVAPTPFADVTHEDTTAAATDDGGIDLAAPAARFDLNASPSWHDQRHCTFPWNFAAIDAHGNVLPCGWWYGEEPLGNIHASSFGAIWRGERFERLRDELRRRQPRSVCRHCPAAGMGSADAPRAFQERG